MLGFAKRSRVGDGGSRAPALPAPILGPGLPVRTGFALAVGLLLMTASSGAKAADVDGVWASDAAVCNKIFTRKGAQISLAKGGDPYGRGFIIEGNAIRGKTANCKIKSRKQNGNVVYLIAACATDVMLSDIELGLKIIDDNKIARVFAGMPEMETPYYRCRK
jgi:hypothetical protein